VESCSGEWQTCQTLHVLQYIINVLQCNAVAQWVGTSLISKVRIGYITVQIDKFWCGRTLQLVKLMTKICLAQKQTFCTTNRHKTHPTVSYQSITDWAPEKSEYSLIIRTRWYIEGCGATFTYERWHHHRLHTTSILPWTGLAITCMDTLMLDKFFSHSCELLNRDNVRLPSLPSRHRRDMCAWIEELQ
jgi:hypothetical protein